VGKSTFVRDQLNPDLTINLLQSRTYLELKRDPGLLQAKVKGALEAHRGRIRVFIDEIQKLPALLDEVHTMIEELGVEFILSGSSARKLKREGANLLAGRAKTKRMYPFSIQELADHFPVERLLEIGTLPVVLDRAEEAHETLTSYVETYLREEIREEALTRSLDDFIRFLEVAGQLNGQVLNFEKVASETGRSGDTIRKWYQILEETFIASPVTGFKPGLKVRETSAPKYYFFDAAVARCAAGLLGESLDPFSRGVALESLVLNELKIRQESTGYRKSIHYYNVPGSEEIDFIVETRKKTIDRPGRFVSIEVKATHRWRSEFERASRSLKTRAGESHERMLGVYLGEEVLKFGDFEVFPIAEYVSRLHSGGLF
jgi:predicted AAA+ superfamily ATPase